MCYRTTRTAHRSHRNAMARSTDPTPGRGRRQASLAAAVSMAQSRTELRENKLTSAAQAFLRNECPSQQAALRAHGVGDVNRQTWKKELDRWRDHINPPPLSPPASAAAAARVVSDTDDDSDEEDITAPPRVPWAALKAAKTGAYVAALADEFKAHATKDAARAHAGAMYAGALPSHNDGDGKCLHGKLVIAQAIKNAGIPGVTSFSPNTVAKAAEERASGSTGQKLPDWFSEELLMWVRFQREIFRLPVTKTGMLNHINCLVRGTAEAAKFEDGRVPMAWLKAWLKRNKDRVGAGTNRNLEAARDAWTTSRNCALHHVVLAEQLVGCGACVWNKDF